MLSGTDQAAAANALMDALGMVLLCRVEKIRTAYRHPDNDDVTVVIDHIGGGGAFVETEVMATNVAEATVLPDEVERELDRTDSPVVSLTY